VNTVLLDTGPLVSLVNRRERHHDWAAARFGELAPPLETCESVLSEACFLLRRYPGGTDAVMALVERGVVSPSFSLAKEQARVRRFLKRYHETPMSLADACLVRMSELIPDSAVMTLDADFKIYRRHGRELIPLIAPEQF
jgi:predicted nucleic acid-binding protein